MSDFEYSAQILTLIRNMLKENIELEMQVILETWSYLLIVIKILLWSEIRKIWIIIAVPVPLKVFETKITNESRLKISVASSKVNDGHLVVIKIVLNTGRF